MLGFYIFTVPYVLPKISLPDPYFQRLVKFRSIGFFVVTQI